LKGQRIAQKHETTDYQHFTKPLSFAVFSAESLSDEMKAWFSVGVVNVFQQQFQPGITPEDIHTPNIIHTHKQEAAKRN